MTFFVMSFCTIFLYSFRAVALADVLTNLDKNDKMNVGLRISMQFFGKTSKDYSTIALPKKEYAHVMSELATNLTQAEKKAIVKKQSEIMFILSKITTSAIIG